MSQKPEYECSGKLSDGCERLDLGWSCPKIALVFVLCVLWEFGLFVISGSEWAKMDKSCSYKELYKFVPFVKRKLRNSLRLFLSLGPHMMPAL